MNETRRFLLVGRMRIWAHLCRRGTGCPVRSISERLRGDHSRAGAGRPDRAGWRYTVYHHLRDRRMRVGLPIMTAKCASDRELAELMRKARDAKPSLDLARPHADPPVLAVNGEDLSLARCLGNR